MWVLLFLVILTVCVLAREFWALWVPYAAATSLVARGRKDAARRVFERVIATPTLLSKGVRHEARFRLSWLFMENGHYEEAVTLLQTCLQRPLKPAVAANIRQRLAEALEGAGRAGEAQAERVLAGSVLAGAATDAEKLLAQAAMLNKQQKYQEAYAAYEAGLALIPAANKLVRAKVLVQLALAAYNMGEPQQTIDRAEQAIALQPELTIHMTAHSAAGLGYVSLGQLDRAEEHRTKALEMATRAGNKDASARYMVQLAEVQRRRGKLMEAMQLCQQAASLTVKERRSVYAVQYEILSSWGRFEEAADALEQMQRAQGFPTPTMQKRIQAVTYCEKALLLAELDQPEQALATMQEGLADLSNDHKLTTRFEAGRAWIQALLGQADEARAQMRDLEARLPDFAQDPGTQRIVYGALGKACFALNDYAQGVTFWQRYLDCSPDPVMMPYACYHQAMCLLRMDDKTGAQRLLEQAVAFNLDTNGSRRAQRQLALLATA